MKKSNFITLLLTILSMLTLGLGMCMCLLVEWNLFQEGIIIGCIGLIILLVTLVIYRKMEDKAPIKFSFKTISFTLLEIIGALALGIGMSFTMVYRNYVIGIMIGMLGILLLVSLFPMYKGLK